MKIAALTAIALYVGTLMDAAYSQQQQCTSHEKMIELLSKRFLEVPKVVGLVGKKRVMEMYASKTGTWTILITNPEGYTCILAAGQSYEDVPSEFSEVEPKT